MNFVDDWINPAKSGVYGKLLDRAVADDGIAAAALFGRIEKGVHRRR